MPLKLVTWNVNSIRARLDHVLTYLDDHEPDIVCLQETKVEDRLFPRVPFMEMGYEVTIHGTKGYCGVATLSRSKPTAVDMGFVDGQADQAPRILRCTFDDLVVYNLYCPNGKALGTDAFAYKLDWFRRLRTQLDTHDDPNGRVLLCGDFNIAPDERDVWDVASMEGGTHFSPEEHEVLANLLEFGLQDCFRKHVSEGGKFTWFDYRNASFQRGHGLRIDHVYVTPSLYEQSASVMHDFEPRDWDTPSDHVPVMATFEV